MIGDTMRLKNALRVIDSLAKTPKPPVGPGALQYTVALAHAYLALDRRDSASAIREFASLPDSLCHECGWSWLTRAELLESQGRVAEAAAILDHTSVLNSTMGTLTEFARARLAEKLGDKARARDGYAFVAGMWQRGDPFFLQYANEARAGLKRLSGENSGVAIPVTKR
jgi:predicted Zn-dependent protease